MFPKYGIDGNINMGNISMINGNIPFFSGEGHIPIAMFMGIVNGNFHDIPINGNITIMGVYFCNIWIYIYNH